MQQKLTCGPGLLIGIPTLGRPITLEWALQYKGLNPPINYSVNVMVPWGKAVDQARNEVCEEAVKQGHKYVFFLGDDVIPPFATLKQLIFRAEQDPNLGVVGGVYCSKCDPPAPLVFRGNGVGSYWDWKAGEFFEVTGLGMDCTLIRTDVLRELPKPWFKTIDDDDFKDARNMAEQWTEDLYFCKKVLETTKYKIWCDSSLLCKHVDVYGDKAYSLPSNSLPTRKLNLEKAKRGVDIGCGPLDRSEQFPGYDLVRVDIRDDVNPDYRCDVRLLPFDNESFDLVFSSHVLEHLGRTEWEEVLKEWLRILKPGGEVFLVLPNIEWAIKNFKSDVVDVNVLNVFYGAQSNPYDFHYNGLWPKRVAQALKDNGVNEVNVEESGYNMILRGKKTGILSAAPAKEIKSPKKAKIKHGGKKN